MDFHEILPALKKWRHFGDDLDVIQSLNLYPDELENMDFMHKLMDRILWSLLCELEEPG